ncbi:Intimal thickness related receptor IRP [Trinorchestia longiramus]|nr:Intimal thickness related receptor IRP [Trinorchestia longiramus]
MITPRVSYQTSTNSPTSASKLQDPTHRSSSCMLPASLLPSVMQASHSCSKTTNRLLLLLLMVLASLCAAEAKNVEGNLKTASNWEFLTRFCFLSNEGKFTFDLEYEMEGNTHQKLLLYYDEPHQWDAVYKTDKTCQEKENVMKVAKNQFVNLTLFTRTTDCEIVMKRPGNRSSYHCRGHRVFASSRERWWFIAVSNCEATKGLNLRYRFSLTNGYSYWYKHFSADEFYILRTNLSAITIELGIFFLSLLCASELKRRQMFHSTYRLYIYAIVLQVCGLVLMSAHYGRYGVDGFGFPYTKLLGRILASISTIVTVFFVLLMAKGYNITRGRLRQRTIIRLTAFMSLYSVTYVLLFLYEQNFFDPGEVLYLYESAAGYGLVALRLLGWLMLLYSCYFTLKHYPDKSNFYTPFLIFYTLWFIAGPVIILISNLVIDKWVREKVVNGVEHAVVICGHLFFLFITRPNASNFPYHVRTSQIAAMEETETGKLGNNTLDKFAAHVYEPDVAGSKNYTTPDLFIVSGSVHMRPVGHRPSLGKVEEQHNHWRPPSPPQPSASELFSDNNTRYNNGSCGLYGSNDEKSSNNIPLTGRSRRLSTQTSPELKEVSPLVERSLCNDHTASVRENIEVDSGEDPGQRRLRRASDTGNRDDMYNGHLKPLSALPPLRAKAANTASSTVYKVINPSAPPLSDAPSDA